MQVNADGKIAVTEDLTMYGGWFSGFDTGVTGVTPATSNVTRGIVYNDVNSNGIQDPGEAVCQALLCGSSIRTTRRKPRDQRWQRRPGRRQLFVPKRSGWCLHSGDAAARHLDGAESPPGVSTNANGSDGIVVGVTFSGAQPIETIGFTDGNDNWYSAAIKSADLQASGQDNLVIRTSSALFVQRFQSDGTSVFDRYAVSSPAGYFSPKLFLEDINADGRIDIVTSGQSGVDVFVNIGLGVFRPFTGLLADRLNNTPGTYTPGRGFTDDFGSGVTSAKTYTHALNFGGNDITVNGVTFKGRSQSVPTTRSQRATRVSARRIR